MFIKYPSIDHLKTVKKNLMRYNNLNDLTNIQLTGTVKIHGTNAGFTLTKDDSFHVQSRNRNLSLESDNAGFCQWVVSHKEVIEPTLTDILSGGDYDSVTVYGEWCGGNIQKNVGVSGADKHFIVFSVMVTSGSSTKFIPVSTFNTNEIPNCELITDFETYTYSLDLTSQESVDGLNTLTIDVENECPVAKKLNPEGNLVGEGIVWTGEVNGRFFMFKHKGEKHSRGGGSKKVSVSENYSEEALSDLKDFLSIALSVDRLKQGVEYLEEMGLDTSPKSTGEFLKWVSKDIIKECSSEVSDLYKNHNIEWKALQREITKGARDFFLNDI